jgi:hypothetical protein
MLRQVAFSHYLIPLRGAPPKIKARQPSWKVLHQSERPAAQFLTEYGDLGLKYQPTYQPPSINKFGWSPKPENSPEYPFFVFSPSSPSSVSNLI